MEKYTIEIRLGEIKILKNNIKNSRNLMMKVMVLKRLDNYQT